MIDISAFIHNKVKIIKNIKVKKNFKDYPLLDTKKKSVPIFYPHIPKNAKKQINKVLSGRWLGQGPLVDKFEKIFSNFRIINFLEVFLFKNLLANIGDKVKATKEDTTIENDNAIAVSLNNVPEIPLMKIKGKKTATKINGVAIIANEICFDPL